MIAVVCSAVVQMGLAGEERPNIIYIMADDQRADTLGCMGNPVLKTPNHIKRSEGVRTRRWIYIN